MKLEKKYSKKGNLDSEGKCYAYFFIFNSQGWRDGLSGLLSGEKSGKITGPDSGRNILLVVDLRIQLSDMPKTSGQIVSECELPDLGACFLL